MRRVLTLLNVRRAVREVLACVVTAGVPASAVAAPVQGGQQAAAVDETNTTTADGTATVTVLSHNDVQTAAAEDGDFPRLVELNASSFYATNDDEDVAATKAYLDGEELVVQFRDADLNRLADGRGNAHVEVYGTYTDDRYADARAYWDGSAVDSDLTVFAAQGDSQGESSGNKGGGSGSRGDGR